MIRCEHCGSTLPDGAIFCGECGRSVNVSANRRPAPAAPVDDAPPPPLRQPDQFGRRPDPAADAWLPEATLDPATRAWLTGDDRRQDRSPAARVDRPAEPSAPAAPAAAPSWTAPDRSAPDTSGHGAPAPRPEPAGADHGQGAGDPTPEPALDPDAYASTSDRSASADGSPQDGLADPVDTERTRPAPTTVSPSETPADGATPTAPAWAPPAAQQPTRAPSRPSWWVGRGPDAGEPPVDARQETSAPDEQPRAGDTAVVEPLVDRRPAPTPLIAPGSGPATCPVCGHTLEPDDIFCAECGAVRPTVTAAFTGPVVPLPMARPDWAADDEIPVDGPAAGDPAADDAATDDAAADDAAADDAAAYDAAAVDDAAVDDPAATDPAPATDTEAAAAGSPEGPTADDGEPDGTPTGERTSGPGRHLADHSGDARDADPAAGSLVAPVIPSAPVSPTVPSSAPRADLPDLPPVPRAAPLPPIPGATGPVLPPVGAAVVPSSGDAEDEDEDVEETRIVAKTTTNAPFVLHFSTGERTAVHGTGLLGRLPRPQPGERFDDLLTVHDPGKSVSKTHLELGRDGDDLWVSDRFSGNGTVVRHIDGSIRRCEPGRRYRVERGARVDIGEQFFLVQ